jgi:CDP-diacylglycerol---serine O-phosphatidyltransferase
MTGTAEVAARPPGIEEPLNAWLVHPAARALLPIAIRLGITPNAISIAGVAFGFVAAVAYRSFGDWRLALLGFAAMLFWHVCDGLDGMVARATGTASPLGRFLDGVCDYSVFVMVYVSLAIAAGGSGPVWALAILAGSAHAVQSAYYEALRERYVNALAGGVRPRRAIAGGALGASYSRLQSLLLDTRPDFDRWLSAGQSNSGRHAAALRPLLRVAAILGATARTLAILAACLAGSPLFYWLWEVAVLLPLTVLFELWRRRIEARLAG